MWLRAMLAVLPLLAIAEIARSAQEGGEATKPSFTVLIVDGRDGTPLPNAEVRWYECLDERLEEHDMTELMESIDESFIVDYQADDELAARSGHITFTDADGRVTVAAPLESTILVVHAGALWGRTTGYMDGATEQRLEVFPDAELVVNISDARGQPAPDVPVVIQYRSDSDSEKAIARMRAVSDTTGIARIPHVGFSLGEILSGWKKYGTETTWSVTPNIIAQGLPEAEIDPFALPKEPIQLRLPSLGSVELTVRAPDGQPAEFQLQPTLLFAANLPEGIESGPTRGFSGGKGKRQRVEVHDGRAVFQHVGLGSELAVKIVQNSASQTVVQRFAGPTQEGEQVKVTVTLGSGGPTFVGRLMDTAGEPIAARQVAVDLFSLPSPERIEFANRGSDETIHSDRGSATTDAQGLISISYMIDSAYDGKPLLVLTLDRNGPDCCAARLDLGQTWSPGQHELGDVVLTPVPIVASGKVVDADGRPIAGVTLEISVFKGSPHIVAISDQFGDFALRSAEPLDRLHVVASSSKHLSKSLNAQLGQQDLLFVMALAGSMKVPIIFPEGSVISDFYFHVERDSTDGARRGDCLAGDQGSLHLINLEPGTYSLWCRRHLNGPRVIVTTGIVVVGGETTEVATIDLGEAMKGH